MKVITEEQEGIRDEYRTNTFFFSELTCACPKSYLYDATVR